MKNRITSLRLLQGLFSIVCAFTILSCGSYQGVSYYDGIYGDTPSNRTITRAVETNEEVVSYEDDSSTYYKALFAQQASQYGNFGETQDSVFTDVENYSPKNYDNSEMYYEGDYQGRSGFGESPNQVIVNYYDNGWGWNNVGWNNWGWNNWGWNNWGWGNPWVWNNGWGFYGPNRGRLAFVGGNRLYRGSVYGNASRYRTSSINSRNTIRTNVGRGRGTTVDSRGRSTGVVRSRSSRNPDASTNRRSSSRSRGTINRRSSSNNYSATQNRSSRRSSGTSTRSSRSSSSRSSGTMRSGGSSRSSGSRSSSGRSSSRGGRRG